MPSRVVDIAGVPVAVRASDAERDAILRAGLTGFGAAGAPAVATISVDAVAAAAPDSPPSSELLGVRFWDEPNGMAVTAPAGLVVRVTGNRADVHVPDLAALPYIEKCLYLPLTWLLARHDRFVLHGAAVVRDGRALLLLGHSGAGKSTLVVAALEAGWHALADDVVVVHPDADTDGMCIHGIHRAPAVPTEIGGPLADSAPRLDDPRDRASLPRAVLTAGGHRLAGVVLVTHADTADGALQRARGHQVLPLLLQSFSGTVDQRLRTAYFETARALNRLPLWDLGHAADPAIRRERAAHHLDQCAAELDSFTR